MTLRYDANIVPRDYPEFDLARFKKDALDITGCIVVWKQRRGVWRWGSVRVSLPYTGFWECFAGGGGNPACYKNSKISGAVPEGAVTMQAAASLFGFVASAPLGRWRSREFVLTELAHRFSAYGPQRYDVQRAFILFVHSLQAAGVAIYAFRPYLTG